MIGVVSKNTRHRDSDRSSLYLTEVKTCELVSEGKSVADGCIWVPADFVRYAFALNGALALQVIEVDRQLAHCSHPASLESCGLLRRNKHQRATDDNSAVVAVISRI